ncbi:nacht nucleoside triphosphatase [Fusarium pseudocircinatum]|uniref:Nacht nucleoside triphosphatase n=1 Tax=Fusarium pseudocircinatum TaxID=56676 RepID=A0A8H5UL56_9HYPO|nr:nacht nucleoside triphosphatase [Fusarium pseudocircinatum]
MDPISAVGIANATAQFIAFASELLSTTAGIYNSAGDASAYASNLDTVYSHLKLLCRNLNQASKKVYRDQLAAAGATGPVAGRSFNSFTHGVTKDVLESISESELRMGNTLPELHDVYSTLQEVVKSCDQDSTVILSLISKLKLENSAGSLTKSLKLAIKLVWKKDEIQRLDERLKRSQAILIAIMVRISNIYQVQHSRELTALRTESQALGARYSQQLSDMQSSLRNIEQGMKYQLCDGPFLDRITNLELMMRQSSLSEARLRKELDIIRSLSFKNIHARHDAICDAHHETFGWAFRAPSDEQTDMSLKQREAQKRLLNWLESGSGVFWVSGKPGSGKSTFMKFVADHHRTMEALSRWAHPGRAIISSCYFWNSGLEMQKSLVGLLQTLLCDVFKACPQLIESACPSRWSGDVALGERWSESELRDAISRISGQKDANFRFCFFIDGLDEYESLNGDHNDFCEYLKTISSPYVKICLSSRPWNEFNDAFGQDPASRIFIHDLTWKDILMYSQDRLQKHPRWKLLESQMNKARTLAKTVAIRAQGVFLWVFLVTRLLREGLSNDDSFADLEKRLLSIPTELETFFRQILESVPSFYHEKMAGTLRVALYAREPLDSMIYSFVGDEYEDPNYFRHSFNPESDLNPDEAQNHLVARQKQIGRRLKGWCRGLLDEQMGKVHFLHRTVGEFLRTRQMSDFLESKLSVHLNCGLSILKAYLAWLNLSNLEGGNFMLFEDIGIKDLALCDTPLYLGLKSALKYASYLELEENVSKPYLDSLIDEMDVRLARMARAIKPLLVDHVLETSEHVSGLIRIAALDLPLMGYLSRKLSTEPSFLSVFGQSPISTVLWTPTLSHSTWPAESREKLECVLRSGSNPNELTVGSMHMITVWERFLSEILPQGPLTGWTRAGPKFQDAIEHGLVQLFLDFGANPQSKIWLDSINAVSALILFVAASFDLEWNELAEEMYFQALDHFIQGGATLVSSESSLDEFGSSGLDQTLLEVSMIDFAEFTSFPRTTATGSGQLHCKLIFDQFEEKLRTGDWSSSETPQRLFFARLLKKILPFARKASWPVDKYQHLIDRSLNNEKPRPGDIWRSLRLKRCRTVDFDEYGNETKRSFRGD